MPNTMDCIVIRYGIPRMSEADRLRERNLGFRKALKQGNILDYLKNTSAAKEYKESSITDFLKLKPETLSPDEQKIQKILNVLYKINGQNHPLYTTFPDRDKSLVIDLTTVARENCAARYLPDEHKIEFNQIEQVKSEWQLLNTLAHEIKHAQQWFDDKDLNNYQQHEIGFLQEAQARACSERAIYTLNPKHPYCVTFASYIEARRLGELIGGPKLDPQKLETDCIKDYLFKFFDDQKFKRTYAYYKDQYDYLFPIKIGDKPLSAIPPSFGLDKDGELDIIEDLKARVPREARTLENKICQAIENSDTKAFSESIQKRGPDGKFLITEDNKKVYVRKIVDKGDITLFNTLLSTKILKPDDLRVALERIFFQVNPDCLTPEIIEGQKKIFDVVMQQKDTKGNNIISSKDIKFSLEIAQMDQEDGNVLLGRLVDHAQKYLRNPRVRLSEAQTQIPKQSKSAQKISKTILDPER